MRQYVKKCWKSSDEKFRAGVVFIATPAVTNINTTMISFK